MLKTVLVTGYNGFIGSNLIPELQKKFNIIGISRLKHPSVKIKQIKHDISQVNKINLPEKISTIIHLAALTDVNFCQNNIEKAFVNMGFDDDKDWWDSNYWKEEIVGPDSIICRNMIVCVLILGPYHVAINK